MLPHYLIMDGISDSPGGTGVTSLNTTPNTIVAAGGMPPQALYTAAADQTMEVVERSLEERAVVALDKAFLTQAESAFKDAVSAVDMGFSEWGEDPERPELFTRYSKLDTDGKTALDDYPFGKDSLFNVLPGHLISSAIMEKLEGADLLNLARTNSLFNDLLHTESFLIREHLEYSLDRLCEKVLERATEGVLSKNDFNECCLLVMLHYNIFRDFSKALDKVKRLGEFKSSKEIPLGGIAKVPYDTESLLKDLLKLHIECAFERECNPGEIDVVIAEVQAVASGIKSKEINKQVLNVLAPRSFNARILWAKTKEAFTLVLQEMIGLLEDIDSLTKFLRATGGPYVLETGLSSYIKHKMAEAKTDFEARGAAWEVLKFIKNIDDKEIRGNLLRDLCISCAKRCLQLCENYEDAERSLVSVFEMANSIEDVRHFHTDSLVMIQQNIARAYLKNQLDRGRNFEAILGEVRNLFSLAIDGIILRFQPKPTYWSGEALKENRKQISKDSVAYYNDRRYKQELLKGKLLEIVGQLEGKQFTHADGQVERFMGTVEGVREMICTYGEGEA